MQINSEIAITPCVWGGRPMQCVHIYLDSAHRLQRQYCRSAGVAAAVKIKVRRDSFVENYRVLRLQGGNKLMDPLTNFPLLFHFPGIFFEILSFQLVKPNKSKLLGVLLECFVFQFQKSGSHIGSKAQ